jgi:ribulose-bisphosphate carboxylase large chain
VGREAQGRLTIDAVSAGAVMRVRYRLRLGAGEEPAARAAHLAREQTVEIPEGVAAREVEARSIGRVESVVDRADGRFEATIAYPVESTGRELPQLLNVLWGNVSLQSGVRVEAIDWPAELVAAFRGPAFGVDGVRALCRAHGRPLTATALKPLGLAPRELGRLAAACALGGIDLIKDDHSLADQAWAPFEERVRVVHELVESANRASGGATLYLPNLTGPVDRLAERVDTLAALGVRAAMVAPLIVGLDQLRALAESSGLALLAHPALAGSLVGAGHGLSPGLLFGDLFRLAGADAVVFPNTGGRFPHSYEDCLAIEARLAAPIGAWRRSFLVLGGGVDLAKLETWIPRYSVDTIWLVGGNLFAQRDLRAASAELAQAVRDVAPRADTVRDVAPRSDTVRTTSPRRPA